jgi:hypothetical protein
MYCALVVHTFGYAAFLEDPFTWVILAAGVSIAPFAVLAKWRISARADAHEPVPVTAA